MITIGSQFRPFSYDEMVKPINAATEAHMKNEEELADLNTKASIWKGLANEQTDPIAAKRYQRYAADLENSVAELANSGLSPSSRQNMLDLKSRYSAEIIPIEQAYTKVQEEKKRRQALRDKDSSIVFEEGPISLDTFLTNPDKQYGSMSVNEAYATASKDFANLAKQKMREGNWSTILGGQYFSKKIQQGYKPEEIMQLVGNDPNAPKELKELYQNTLNSFMGRGNWDSSSKEAIVDAINRAAAYGIGQVDSKELKAEQPKAATTGKTSKDPLIQRTSFTFSKAAEKVPELIDKDGKLKTKSSGFFSPNFSIGKNEMDLVFKDGKFTNPESYRKNLSKTKGMVSESTILKADSERENAYEYYTRIANVLLDAGFSQEMLDNMTKEDVERSLYELQQKGYNDAVSRDLYKVDMDKTASNELMYRMNASGVKVSEVTSMRDGKYQTADSEQLKLDEDSSATLYIDPKTGDLLMSANGKNYKMDKGKVMSNEDSKYIDSVVQQLPSLQQAMKTLEDKYYKNGKLTEEEIATYNEYKAMLDNYNTGLGTIAGNLGKAYGKKNLNE